MTNTRLRLPILRQAALLFCVMLSVAPPALADGTLALVGGTLVDGFGGQPIRRCAGHGGDSGGDLLASALMGVSDEVGTVTPGKYADIIAVRGDALRHIALLQRVDVLVRRGRRYR